MTPEEKARLTIDNLLERAGWTVQDIKDYNPNLSLGVAVREFPLPYFFNGPGNFPKKISDDARYGTAVSVSRQT